MAQYSFLATPRWIGLIVLMLIASIACLFLGEWQYGRYQEKVAAATQLTQTWDREIVPLEDITGDENEWQLTSLTGEFVPDSQVLLRGRSVNSLPAVHVIALFVTERGGEPLTVIVDRGWVYQEQAEGDGQTDGYVQPPPTGKMTIEARMRPSEDAFDRTPPEGYIYTLNPDQVLAGIPQDVTEGLPPVFDGRFTMTEHSDETGAPQPYPKPSTTLGSHLAYSWEWRFFALAALAVVPILARREAQDNAWIIDGVDLRELDLTDEEKRDLGLAPKRVHERRTPSDEDIEDDILDQASAISSK